MTDDAALFRLAAGSGGRLCAFFHLPIQSGSDALLARIGRPYGAARIRATLDAKQELLSQLDHTADLPEAALWDGSGDWEQKAQTVVIHHIITKDTIDERIMSALRRKDKTQSALIDAVKANLEV